MMEEKRQLTPADKAKCKWTQEEEYYLQDKWGEVSIKVIAKTLGRSENAIIVRAQRMGLGAHLHADSRVTANQLMKAVYGGKQQGGWTMNRWIENGLPIKKHLVKNSRFKVIDIDDFWKWAEQNKDIVNFSQMEENVLGKEPEWVKQKKKDRHPGEVQKNTMDTDRGQEAHSTFRQIRVHIRRFMQGTEPNRRCNKAKDHNPWTNTKANKKLR